MNLRNVQQRLTITVFLCLGLAVFVAGYNAIGNIVAEQSRLQQQALSPVYKLVRDELLRPLYIAETFATSVDFTTVMGDDDIDEIALLARLKKMEEDLGLVFFVASEKKRRQYFSNGRTIELIEGAESVVDVTASFGVAFGSAATHQLSDLLAAADTALYEAKRSGRNQVRTRVLA